MPTYEFRCPQGHEFEKLYRTISGAEAQAACPQCGELAERMMSATGFAFKGSGFYLTDYGKNAHRGTAAEGKSPAGDTGGGASDGGAAEKSGAQAASGDGGGAPPAAPSVGTDSKKPAAEPKPAPSVPKKSAE